jgi:hypothetical protein
MLYPAYRLDSEAASQKVFRQLVFCLSRFSYEQSRIYFIILKVPALDGQARLHTAFRLVSPLQIFSHLAHLRIHRQNRSSQLKRGTAI